MGLMDESDNIFEVEDPKFFSDALYAPASFNPRTFDDMDVGTQLPDDTAFLFANDQVYPANSVDVAPLTGLNVGDDPAVPSQDIPTDWTDDDSKNGWDGIAPASTLLDITDPSSDPSASSGLADTGYLTTTSPTHYLGGPLKHFNIRLPDLMTIFKEKCPPIRDGEKLIPLCCTGGRKGQTVTDCRPHDITNWNCYLRDCQYCCKLFITESQEGVSCLKGFA